MGGLFESRRFWLAIAAGVVAFSEKLGFAIDPETANQLVLAIAAWIVGDSLRETKPKRDR